MTDHERALELAAASFDFELSPADDEELTAHLAACESCRATVAGLRADAAALSALVSRDAPAGLRQRVLDAVQDRVETPPAVTTGPATPRLLQFPSRIPARFRHPAALVAAAAVIVAVVAGTLAWRTGPTDQGIAITNPSAAPSGASGGPGGSGGPGPTNPPGPSNPELVTADAPVAQLTAVAASGGVVDVDSGFLLASIGGTPAAELARHVTVTPALTLTETVQADGTVLLTPAEPLVPGAVYQFTLAGDEGQTLDTWAFQARQPLHVVSTLPGNLDTDVPVATGIEVTFDQDGVVDAASHMTIEPKVEGRFEQHDRVLAFVPDRLAPATIYTVTVTRGVAIEATGDKLETDVRFQFETAAAGAGEPGGAEQTTFRFASDLFESATAARPTISLWAFGNVSDDETKEPKAPETARLQVYRLPDESAAIDAFRQLRSSPRWSQWNHADSVPTKGLTQVAGLDAHLEDANGTLWTRLPEALAAGWYLVEWPSTTERAQAVLQVTDIAGYLVVSETKTLVWANDLGSGKPIAAGTVTAEGAALGQTGADGTLMVDTPPALLPDLASDCATGCVPVVSVSSGGRAAFLPATGASNPDGKDTDFGFFDLESSGHPKYWRLFHTDRSRYRTTDTVNAWGMLRDRVSGTVPDNVTVRLVLSSDDSLEADAPIAQVDARTRPTGAFTGSLALRDIPEGSYRLQLVAGGEVVAEEFIEVGRILKPAYRLEVVTGRRVYIEGDRIKVTASASFYDGTPVPGVPLRLSGIGDRTPTTDATGTAVVRGTAVFENEFERDDPEMQQIYVQPARAEEGDIEGAARDFLVFPSMWTVRADSEVRGGRVQVSGAVNVVDRDRLETEIAGGAPVWDLDPRGAAVKSRTVTVTFTELIPERTQVGTTYDFVEKRVVPLYDYQQRERTAGRVKVTTDSHGRFSGSIRAPNADHDYSIKVSLTDPDGHVAEGSTYASKGVAFADGPDSPYLSLTDGGVAGTEVQFGIGDKIDLTMREPGASAAADGDRHLFYLAQNGLREATVDASSRYVTTFPDWGPPNVVIGAVRFTGSGYVAGFRFGAGFRKSDRAITMDLQPDKARYAPGDDVTLAIRTRDAKGRALPATVVIRAIDEKLYSIGAAAGDDPLNELYGSLTDGIRATYASHRNPRGRGDGADTGGGGGDAEFRDALLFKAVDTGTDGRGSVTFRLSDDLTSWRVSATAIGAGLETGGASTQVPVGLPFFVDAAIAPEYLLADRPSIQVRAFGSALEAGDRITFSVEADSLGLHESGLHAPAFDAVTVPLPELKLGKHSITITATAGSGASARRYRVTRSFMVVASRLTRTQTTYTEPTARTGVQGGDGLTDIVVSDAGAGRELPVLLDLAAGGTARLERGLAADVASALIAERFAGPGDETSAPTFDGSAYQTEDGGIAILPYASSNLETSALAALVAPDRFTGQSLSGYFRAIAANPSETRERRAFALAGLAGLGAPVLSELRAMAADADLTIRERLMLGLGAAALGDTDTAHAIAASLAAAYGESVDGRARLRVGDDATDITSATALMAMLMAATGDPVAPRYRAYVEANPSSEATFALQTVGYVKRVLARLAPQPTSFVYEIGGKRTVVKLEPGDSLRLTLTKQQLASLSIEPDAGAIGVTSSWREAVDAGAFAKDPDVTIVRTVKPSRTLKSSDLVTVDLTVTFGPKAAAGCHRVTELVPSGLVPVGVLRGFLDEETGEPVTDITYPEEQAGQRVVFCADAGPKPSVRLRYVARVITVGTYAWEPTIVESRSASDEAAIVPRGEVTIR